MDPTLPKKRGRPRKRPLPEAEDGATDGKSGAEGKKQERVTRPVALVGRYVLKEFEGNGKFLGKIVYYDSGLYRVNYEDGDCEDLDSCELRAIIVDDNRLNEELNRKRKKLDKLLTAKSLRRANATEEEVKKSVAASPNEACDVPILEDKGDLIDGDVDAGSSSDSCDCEQDEFPPVVAEAPSLPLPPEFPVSSGNIGVPEEVVSYLLSVYGLLRSFSITLFLCPFGLDDFVGAVNCPSPNTLLDSIHVALMRVLKVRLENLSLEGSEVAAKCLRCIDWSLLDILTWPVYVLHYLTVMGHVKGLEWKGFYDKILDKDYYSLPVDKKLLILQVLCDDALDSAQLRAEIDVREESEVGVDSDGFMSNPLENRPRRVHPRYSKTSACNNKGATEAITGSHEMSSHSFPISKASDAEVTKMTADGANVDADENGDECRLCGMDGTLLCCDGCPAAYHSRCIGVVKMHMPEGPWYCPECAINKIGPKITSGPTLVGAELFGTDPYEQVFMGTCNHLLVMKVSFPGTCRYYNQKDIVKVLQALNSSMPHSAMYFEICNAIARYWYVPENAFRTPEIARDMSQIDEDDGKTFSSHSEGLVSSGKNSKKFSDAADTENVNSESETAADIVALSSVRQPSDQTTQNGNLVKETDGSSAAFVDKHEEPSDRNNQNACDGSSSIDYPMHLSGNTGGTYSGHSEGIHLPTINFLQSRDQHGGGLGEGDRSLAGDWTYLGSLFKPQTYMNHYVHGYFAASAAANLTTLTAEEGQVLEAHAPRNPRKVVSAIAQQMKAFSSAASRFFWPSSERKLWEVPRERCGWCYTCQSPPSSRRGCMLNAAASTATRSAMKFLSLHPTKNGEWSLASILTYISLMAKSFQGLIYGPFLSDNFRKKWHETVENVLSCSILKALLLDLEEHIRPIALSGEWFKVADDCLVEDAVQGATCIAGTQKRGPGGRRNKKQTSLPEVAADDCLERSFTWWRGGKLSKLLLNKAILPSSMIRKAARQGGLNRIPGVHYVDSSEIPKRTRRSMWRAAVEMSKNESQLALQVRYIDLYLRWNDLVRPEANVQESKGPEIEASAFRNAMVCDKKLVGNKIMYGVDFGTQKHLPSRVMKSIIDIEQSQDGKEKYWFSEAHVPLYLIREYEETVKVPLPGSTTPSNVLLKMQRLLLKRARMDIFSYLTCRRDNVEKFSCSSCRQDVSLRNVVICSKCQGKCHQDCIIGSRSSVNKEVNSLFICKQCAFLRVESTESPTSPLLLQTREYHKVRSINETLMVKGLKAPPMVVKSEVRTLNEIPKVNKSSKTTPLVAAKSQEKQIKKASSGTKSATKPRNTTWGIIWRKNNAEETGYVFRLDNILLRGKAGVHGPEPVCKLCEKPYNPELTYVRCPACTKWFHADALELEESKLSEVIGFKCCKCRRIRSPQCPYDDKIKNRTAKKLHPPNVKQDPLCLDSDSGDLSDLRGWEPTTPLISSEELVMQDDDPLLHAASRVEQLEDDEFEWGPANASGPGLQKLPVRRHMKQDSSYFDSTAPLEMDSPVNNAEKTSPTHLATWDGSADGEVLFDYDCLNYEDMEFEPQTYFSFTELLAPEDDAMDASGDASVKWENWNGGLESDAVGTTNPNDDLGFTISVDPPIDVYCQVCSNSEPCPDLFCEVCCIWIHSHCSPWNESELGNSGWRCGDCRDWR